MRKRKVEIDVRVKGHPRLGHGDEASDKVVDLPAIADLQQEDVGAAAPGDDEDGVENDRAIGDSVELLKNERS